MTTTSEKIRLLRWLRQTLHSGRKIAGGGVTQSAADEIDRILGRELEGCVKEQHAPFVVNFATERDPSLKSDAVASD